MNKLLKFISSNSKKNTYLLRNKYRVGVLLKGHEYARSSQSDTQQFTEEMVESFYDAIEMMNEHELSKYINREILLQLVDMFSGLENNNHSSKFQITCGTSTIKNAGDGVFVKCSESTVLNPGTVVAIYPGNVYLKEHLKDLAFFRSLLPDPDFMLMTTADDCIIDGRASKMMPPNPYALAHKINHCGKNRSPNVLQVSFDFPSDIIDKYSFPFSLRQFIPNRYAKQPSFLGKLELHGCLMKTVVFVSSRPLKNGDELLMDYKLNPDSNSLPEWYEAFDADDARERWSKD